MTLKARITAIDRFIKGLKEDGIYGDLQAACVMAGWDSLAGALTPLVGAAPTNSGFIATDYDRGGIGIAGDGTSYLNSNRANNADPQNDTHLSVYATAPVSQEGISKALIGTGQAFPDPAQVIGVNTSNDAFFRSNTSAAIEVPNQGESTGLYGVTRSTPSSFTARVGGSNTSQAIASLPPPALNSLVFARLALGAPSSLSDCTLSFYSIGTSLDLALLEARVSTLMADLRAIEEAGFDRDAIAYIRAVEEADGAFLETSVKTAINNLVSGLKADSGLWDAIGSSCLLCGPRTLAGALVPLRGDAPTAYGFVEGDFDREGLTGDGTSYLDSNVDNNEYPQDDFHMAALTTSFGALSNANLMGTGSIDGGSVLSTTDLRFRNRSLNYNFVFANGFIGTSRNESASFNVRSAGATTEIALASISPPSAAMGVFGRGVPSGGVTDATIAFYSIGTSLDLAKLDSHISSYVTAIGAAV